MLFAVNEPNDFLNCGFEIAFLFFHILMSAFFCPQDPAVATSKRVGNVPYGSYDRGTEKNAWVTESDGKTPLLGEVSCVWVQERTGTELYNVVIEVQDDS